MNINSINGVNTQAGQMGMNQAVDSYSRNIRNQIANAQKQLQELSSNQDMTLEEKMKKQQEIQQKISDLNAQLRQHQIEQRKERQQEKNASMDNLTGGTKAQEAKGAGSNNTGLSTASMTAMISADGSVKQAKVQGSVAAQMEGKAAVLKAEIKQDAGRGVEKKKEELADVEQKAQTATEASISTLADANKTVKEAAEKERKDEEKKVSDDKEKKESVSGAKDETEKAELSDNETGEETAKVLSAEPQHVTYKSVDIRL